MSHQPLSYLDLVIATVRGFTPIPEYQHAEVDRVSLAKEHLEVIKNKYSGDTKKPLSISLALTFGEPILVKAWKRLCPTALTMCGDKSIDQLLEAMRTIQAEDIPGDFIEAGVWRGGLPIIMRAFLHEQKILQRKVYLADSFQGLPDELSDPKDKAAHLIMDPIHHLNCSRKQVEDSMNYFGLNDEQVVFLEGWFKDTLKGLSDEKFALIRLDGDYYESTRDAIKYLYPRLSNGGYVIIDDYNLPVGCKKAIDEYRKENGISTPIIKINKQAVYWRK